MSVDLESKLMDLEARHASLDRLVGDIAREASLVGALIREVQRLARTQESQIRGSLGLRKGDHYVIAREPHFVEHSASGRVETRRVPFARIGHVVSIACDGPPGEDGDVLVVPVLGHFGQPSSYWIRFSDLERVPE
jgi:hypothetical protein